MQARSDPARQLAETLRTLGDETRLRIVALLARRPHYGEELAELLGVTPATISHHLKQLRMTGFVDARREAPYVLFHLVEDAMIDALGPLLAPGLAAQLRLPDESELSARILRHHVDDDGRLSRVPSPRRARAAVLRWVASHLETDRLYPERELRLILIGLARDPDEIREALLKQGWLRRSGQIYRRVEEVDAL